MKKYGMSLSVFGITLIFWELGVKYFHIEKFILPAPSQIVQAIINTYPLLIEHSQQTVMEALLGFVLAVLGGIILATLIGLLPNIKRIIYPFIVFSQTIPIMAVAPLFIIWFGYEMLPKVIIVVLVCFFPITVNLIEGIDDVDQDMVKLLLAMGASRWKIFKSVQFPNAMPAFFAGLKISAAYSIMGAVIGEWLGASKGLGVYMTRSMHSFLTDRVFAAIVVISVLSLSLFLLVEILGRLLMPWYYQKTSWQD